MKLWIDDRIPAPEGWVRASSNQEAVRLYDTHEVTEVAIDFDIFEESAPGSGLFITCSETFEPTARFIRAKQQLEDMIQGPHKPLLVTIQTGSIGGRIILKGILEEAPNTKVAVEYTKKPHDWPEVA